MALTSGSNAPYTPAAPVVNLIKRVRDKGLTFPVTQDVLLRAGVAESLLQRTFAALQLLELIDDKGQPTEIFKKLREVPEKDYKATLASWLKQVYAEVFTFADPAAEDITPVRDAFRTYTPHAQQERMVTLFMALCAEAGLAGEVHKAEAKPRQRTPASAPSTPNTLNAAAPRQAVSRGARAPSAATAAIPAGLPPELAGMMARLPMQGWTQATRDKFLKTFESVLDYVIPIIENEADSEKETAS